MERRNHGEAAFCWWMTMSDTLEMLVRLLSGSYEVATAGCYDSALARAEAKTPDVLVTDVGLPGRDGIALMRELRQRFGVRGIAVTGHAIDEVAYRQAGFAGWLRKPIQFDELLRVLKETHSAPAA